MSILAHPHKKDLGNVLYDAQCDGCGNRIGRCESILTVLVKMKQDKWKAVDAINIDPTIVQSENYIYLTFCPDCKEESQAIGYNQYVL